MTDRPIDPLDVAAEASNFILELQLKSHRAAMAVSGDSAEFCEDCGIEIPEARRVAVKGCQRCIDCQEFIDNKNKGVSRGCW